MNLKKLLGVTLLLTPMLGVNDVYAARKSTFKIQLNSTDINNDDSNMSRPKTEFISKKSKMTIPKETGTRSKVNEDEEKSFEASHQQLLSDEDWTNIIKEAEKLKIDSIKKLTGIEIDKNGGDIKTLTAHAELFGKLEGEVLNTYFNLMLGAIKLEKFGYRQSCEVGTDFDLTTVDGGGSPDVFYTIDRNSFMDIVKSYVDYCNEKNIKYRNSFRNLSVSDPGDAIILAPGITSDAPNSLLNYIDPITNKKIQNLKQMISYNNSSIKETQDQITELSNELKNIQNLKDLYTKDEVDKITGQLQEKTSNIGQNLNDAVESINGYDDKFKKIEADIKNLSEQIVNLTSNLNTLKSQPLQARDNIGGVSNNKYDRREFFLKKKGINNKKEISITSEISDEKPHLNVTESRKNNVISDSRNFDEQSNNTLDDNLNDEVMTKTDLKEKSSSETKKTKKISHPVNITQSLKKENLDLKNMEPNSRIDIPHINVVDEKNGKNIKDDIKTRSRSIENNKRNLVSDNSEKLVGDMTEDEFRNLMVKANVSEGARNGLVKTIKRSKRLGEITSTDTGAMIAIKTGISKNNCFKNKTENEEILSELYNLVFKN